MWHLGTAPATLPVSLLPQSPGGQRGWGPITRHGAGRTRRSVFPSESKKYLSCTGSKIKPRGRCDGISWDRNESYDLQGSQEGIKGKKGWEGKSIYLHKSENGDNNPAQLQLARETLEKGVGGKVGNYQELKKIYR